MIDSFILRGTVKNLLQKSAEDYKPRGRLDPAGFMRHIQFRTYPPPIDLRPFVEHFWIISWDKLPETYNSEEVMHRPYVDLFIALDQSGIQGTFRRKRTYTASGSGKIIGVRFKPGAFCAFWDGPISSLQDVVIDIQKVFPHVTGQYVTHVCSLEDSSATDELTRLLRTAKPQPDPNIATINHIISTIEDNNDLRAVTDVAKTFHKSERALQQLFQDYVGVGLKWLLKRKQLLAAAEQIRLHEQPNWAAIAYDIGYSSQQHFITDFKQVTGKTPMQYKKGLILRQ